MLRFYKRTASEKEMHVRAQAKALEVVGIFRVGCWLDGLVKLVTDAIWAGVVIFDLGVDACTEGKLKRNYGYAGAGQGIIQERFRASNPDVYNVPGEKGDDLTKA